jgi:hypothetical protein
MANRLCLQRLKQCPGLLQAMWGGVARRIDLQRQDTTGSVARLHAVLAS